MVAAAAAISSSLRQNASPGNLMVAAAAAISSSLRRSAGVGKLTGGGGGGGGGSKPISEACSGEIGARKLFGGGVNNRVKACAMKFLSIFSLVSGACFFLFYLLLSSLQGPSL